LDADALRRQARPLGREVPRWRRLVRDPRHRDAHAGVRDRPSILDEARDRVEQNGGAGKIRFRGRTIVQLYLLAAAAGLATAYCGAPWWIAVIVGVLVWVGL